MQKKILFIDDHESVREGLIFSLSKGTSFVFLGVSDSASAVKILKENPDCETATIDYELEGETGLDALLKLRALKPKLNALIFSMHTEPLIISKVLQANVQGYVSKGESLAILKNAISQVAGGQNYFNNAAINVMKDKFYSVYNSDTKNEMFFLYGCYNELSPKEKEVFALLAKELSVEEIAEKLHKTVKTIKNQRTSIFEKMMIQDRHELIKAGEKLGL